MRLSPLPTRRGVWINLTRTLTLPSPLYDFHLFQVRYGNNGLEVRSGFNCYGRNNGKVSVRACPFPRTIFFQTSSCRVPRISSPLSPLRRGRGCLLSQRRPACPLIACMFRRNADTL